MGKRPETAPMVRCRDVANILNKFAEPIFWCQPERRFRKNMTGKPGYIPFNEECSMGFDPYTDYVWMPFTTPQGQLLHRAYVDCYYVGDDIGCDPGPDFAIELGVAGSGYATTLKSGFSPSSWDTYTPWSDTRWSSASVPGFYIPSTCDPSTGPIEWPAYTGICVTTMAAFWLFNDVTVNGGTVPLGSYIGAFTPAGVNCGAVEITSFPTTLTVYADDGTPCADGWITAGQVPTFKIYLADTCEYIDADPTSDIAWGLNDVNILPTLASLVTYSNIKWPTLTGSTYDTKIVRGNNNDLVPHTFYVSTKYNDYMTIEWDNTGWSTDGSLFTLKDSGGTDVNINMVTLSPATVNSSFGSINVSDPTNPVLILGDISSRFYVFESGVLQYASITNLKSISFTHDGSVDSTSSLTAPLIADGWVYTWAAAGLTNTITNGDPNKYLSSSLFPVSLLTVVFVAPGASSGSITITSSLNTTGIETYKSLNYIANIVGDCAGTGSGFAWQDPDGICWLPGTGSIDIIVTGKISYLEMAITPLAKTC